MTAKDNRNQSLNDLTKRFLSVPRWLRRKVYAKSAPRRTNTDIGSRTKTQIFARPFMSELKLPNQKEKGEAWVRIARSRILSWP